MAVVKGNYVQVVPIRNSSKKYAKTCVIDHRLTWKTNVNYSMSNTINTIFLIKLISSTQTYNFCLEKLQFQVWGEKSKIFLTKIFLHLIVNSRLPNYGECNFCLHKFSLTLRKITSYISIYQLLSFEFFAVELTDLFISEY